MKTRLENFNKLVRETFEASEQKRYSRAIEEIVAGLDEFTENEAVALLDAAKASITLRRLWRVIGNQAVKQHRSEQVLREAGNGYARQFDSTLGG